MAFWFWQCQIANSAQTVYRWSQEHHPIFLKNKYLCFNLESLEDLLSYSQIPLSQQNNKIKCNLKSKQTVNSVYSVFIWKKKKVFINQVCVAYLQIKYDEHHAGG